MFTRLLLALFLVLLANGGIPFASAQAAASAQPTAAVSDPNAVALAAVRDPRALAVLTQMAAATGWDSTALPIDAVGAGTAVLVKPDGSEVAESIVIKARRGQQLRTEFPLQGTVVVVNGEAGKRVTPTGTEQIQAFATFSIRPLVFPFFTPLLEYTAADVVVASLGTGLVRGEPAQRVELDRKFAVGDGLDEARNRAARLIVSISLTNMLPVEIDYEALSEDNPTSGLPVTCYLSDYRKVGSVVVPFRMEEFAGGRRLDAIQLQSVQLNVGVTDADFSVE